MVTNRFTNIPCNIKQFILVFNEFIVWFHVVQILTNALILFTFPVKRFREVIIFQTEHSLNFPWFFNTAAYSLIYVDFSFVMWNFIKHAKYREISKSRYAPCTQEIFSVTRKDMCKYYVVDTCIIFDILQYNIWSSL